MRFAPHGTLTSKEKSKINEVMTKIKEIIQTNCKESWVDLNTKPDTSDPVLNAWNKSRKELAEKATCKSISEYFASSVKTKFTGTISAINCSKGEDEKMK